MSRLPLVDFRRMEKLLLRLGFERVRQKGSHVFYRHSDGRTTTLPTILVKIYHGRYSVKFCAKSNYLQMNLFKNSIANT